MPFTFSSLLDHLYSKTKHKTILKEISNPLTQKDVNYQRDINHFLELFGHKTLIVEDQATDGHQNVFISMLHKKIKHRQIIKKDNISMPKKCSASTKDLRTPTLEIKEYPQKKESSNYLHVTETTNMTTDRPSLDKTQSFCKAFKLDPNESLSK